ncbi:hypothetical protein psyc5s11_30570 [Clostridium gelidum]|uniref:RES domain-containing protein n=1 Tax=Clostridium gelidum TaxID=704125 RepID=A0ABM7T6J9_9CLOT|nr:RES domain-containing protein [Clostridium gelidum]BCZ46990.1 hypothetical protein psyc5s11_30570 [Clostridium gelidum]
MSDLSNILSKEFFEFPLVNETEDNFKKFISINLDTYIEIIGTLTDKDKKRILNKVIFLSNSIKDSLAEYYNGLPHKAFAKLAKGMDSVKSELKNVSQYYKLTNKNFYRARLSEKELKREEMFHIPYEKRKLISNQRYSIAGFPCLYLGLTPYTCWEELDRPVPNNFTVSMVRLDEKVKILNFAILPCEVNKGTNYYARTHFEEKLIESNYRNVLKSYIKCLPIIMACSVKVKDRKAPFREEYIISQMITQWVRLQGDIDGIQYYSTKTATYSRRNSNLYKNIVIPTKETGSDKGYCRRLSELITITDSVHCMGIDLFSEDYNIDFSRINDKSNGLIDGNYVKEIKIKKGVKYAYGEKATAHYSSSGFMEIVNRLIDKELGNIRN